MHATCHRSSGHLFGPNKRSLDTGCGRDGQVTARRPLRTLRLELMQFRMAPSPCFPTLDEAGGEILPTRGNPVRYDLDRKKTSSFNFRGRQVERAFMLGLEEMNEFMSGALAGINFRQKLSGSAHSELFLKLAGSRFGIIASGIDVASGTRVPAAGMRVLKA